MDDNIGLDVSWINDQQRIQNIQSNYCREPVDNINVYSLYINKNSFIDKITCKKQVVTKGVIGRDIVLGIIQNNKTNASKKYKLVDVVLYHVDLEPEHLQTYSQIDDIQTSSRNFFQVLPIVDEIVVPKSIFIFHSLNSLFFMYKEADTSPHNHTIKSILKPTSKPNDAKKKHTKKVRISLHNREHDYIEQPRRRPRKTRKNVLSVST